MNDEIKFPEDPDKGRPQQPRNTPLQVRLPIFLAFALALGMLLGANMFTATQNNPQSAARSYLKFRDILSYIDRDYVDSVDIEELSDYAISKMLEKLDPHTAYIPASEMEIARSYLEGDFDGIGIEFNIFHDTIYVVAPLAGGPSEAVGLQAGDKIIKVDGDNVAGVNISTQGVFEKLRGRKGSKVELTIMRRGHKKPMEFSVTRDKIPTVSVDASYMIDQQTGYIKVSRFSATTYNEFKQALSKLRKKGMQQLVLDLRDNPGGYMDQATKMADEFIAGNKKIVYTDGKGTKYDSEILSRMRGEFEQGPLIVLINEGSASASEIVSGALQDHDRALLVGRRSFGKGLVQMPIPLNDGSELRLTISRYYTPSGRSIQKPYNPDNADSYAQELIDRFQHGEYFNRDSIYFNDSLQYKTAKGRTVYGGGGIMPDVFVPRDTMEYTRYLGLLYSNNIIREYALNYYNENRKQLEKMTLDKFSSNFEVTDRMLKDVVKEANRANVTFNENEYNRSKQLLRSTLKAFIARSVFGNEGFYPVLHQRDDELQQALRLFDQAEKISKGQI